MDLVFDWVEYVMVLALLAGTFVALLAGGAWALYALAFISGLVFGRVWWKWRKTNQVPVFLAIAAFLVGLAIGGLFASLQVIAVLFGLGILAGYYIHKSSGLALE